VKKWLRVSSSTIAVYHELVDAEEQRARFNADLRERELLGLPAVPVDENLLAALEHGLPDCSGVALGLDRLVMLAVGADKLASAMTFVSPRAD